MRLTYCMRKHLSKINLLSQIRAQGNLYGFVDEQARHENSKKTVVVEYSSPNIAKPFHMGHLRSTILGHFLSNLYERHGWNVVRLNYLGDWGTQFGLLAMAFKKYGDEKKLEEDPLQHLFEIYVSVNKDVSQDPHKINDEAVETFRKMEEGDSELLAVWERLKDISLNEYEKVYKRLGIEFTEHHSESMYTKAGLAVIEDLKQQGLLRIDKHGRGYVEIQRKGRAVDVVVLKSNGTTLYITRELGALIDRIKRYNFDKIHYVVENGQNLHFEHLHGIMSIMPEFKDRLNEDLHVKFGRIHGMSTRAGNVVFLKDILDEGRNIMMKTLKDKRTTKVTEEEHPEIAEELCRSAMFAQDMGQKRVKSYPFSWERVLNFSQDSGPYLNYCHSRLCGIERNNPWTVQEDVAIDHLLTMKSAEQLCEHLEQYNEAVSKSLTHLEPYVIVKYLYTLCHLVNAAYKKCNVSTAEEQEAQAYLQMFNASRLVLANGMTLLGLRPLEKM
ncbi:uncharacterized protein LOC128243495 [Mya arenaria]|uniref:uncharacterized protein LOC128243495 n=1 Tax=Mya arenaria TaxID=6604 RepID=UPI0022DF1170|nr:uncharacterized protein LOC128243495 [Mya arenaria]